MQVLALLACAATLIALTACSEQVSPVSAPDASVVAGTAPASAAASDTAIAGGRFVSSAGRPDRLPPPEVPPLVREGVTYAQAEDGRKEGLAQVSGVLLASDAISGKLLWALAVYPTEADPKLEADVQWVFFRSMAFDPDGRLRVVNEAGKTFLVDVKGRTVVPVH